MKHICLSFLAFAALSAEATLITQVNDTDGAGAAVNGVVGPNEYGPGNTFRFTGGGAGFGGQLGPATLLMNSDASTIYLALTNAGVPVDGNRFMIYLHTRPGGYQTDGVQMNDGVGLNTSVVSRRQSSELTTGGLELVTFFNGVTNNPDFAFIMNNRAPGAGAFSFLYELSPSGTAHGVVTHSVTGFGTSTIEISMPRSALGIDSGGNVDVTALEISETSFLSDEGIPATGLSGNPGFNVGGTTIFSNFHRFVASTYATPGEMTSRSGNSTVRMPATLPASSTNSYSTVDAFPGVVLTNPVALIVPPGETNRLFVLEQAGIIVAITNLAAPTRTVFMDIKPRVYSSGEGGLLGMAFHPGYTTNRKFFVYYTPQTTLQDRVSMFLISSTNANAGDPTSETIFISQVDEADNHNGGDIHFGPDGYLYVALGDEGSFNDNLNNAQIVDRDFFAGLLRIDVDKKPGSLPPNRHPAINGPVTNYAIPPNNPLVGVTNYYGSNLVVSAVRTEFFATGLRNPYRFTFDPFTAEIYVADVGQDAWEEIDIVTNGGNYGWAAREGFVAGPKNFGFPASAYRNPLLAYSHGSGTNQGFSITGGVKYYGSGLPELVDHYIFADYVIGNIWAMTDNGVTNTAFKWLASDANMAGFCSDPRNGEVLMVDRTEGRVKLLVRNTSTGNLPATLADTGIFADLATLEPEVGVEPYDINVPFWSDKAIKRRWFCVPSTNLFVGFSPQGLWTSPTSTLWIKHFDIELTNGVPASRRRLETRVLVKNSSGSGGYGVTYRWGTSTTNAALVQAEGLDEPFVINDAGVIRTQVWRYPSRGECLICHQANAGFALSFNTVQMNRDYGYTTDTTNQLKAMERSGYFSNAVGSVHQLLRLQHATNTQAGLESRARSYLHANCSQCHFPGGAAPGNFDARFQTPLSSAGIVNGTLNDIGSNPSNRVIARGLVTNSMVHTRISFRGNGQMPPVGSNLVDTQSIALVRAWIGALSNQQFLAEWQLAHFGSTNAPDALPGADPDLDGNNNQLEYLTGTSPTNGADAWSINLVTTGSVPAVTFPRIPHRYFEVQSTTNLVEGVWTRIDDPANAPVTADSTTPAMVPDNLATNRPEGHYRVRVTAP